MTIRTVGTGGDFQTIQAAISIAGSAPDREMAERAKIFVRTRNRTGAGSYSCCL